MYVTVQYRSIKGVVPEIDALITSMARKAPFRFIADGSGFALAGAERGWRDLGFTTRKRAGLCRRFCALATRALRESFPGVEVETELDAREPSE